MQTHNHYELVSESDRCVVYIALIQNQDRVLFSHRICCLIELQISNWIPHTGVFMLVNNVY